VLFNWTAATGAFSGPTYTVKLYNGTNTTIFTGSAVGVLYNLSAKNVNGQIVYVNVDDGVVQVTSQGLPFATNLTAVINGTCTVGVKYPNEDNLPSVATVNATYVVVSAEPIVSTISTSFLPVGPCTNVSVGDTTTFTCVYYVYVNQSAGSYPVSLYVTTTGSVFNVTYCAVGELLASQRVTNVVNFPAAVPGASNVQGDQPVIFRNTGNVPLNLSMTSHDLQSVQGGHVLSAAWFKAGLTLIGGTQMQDAVTKDLNVQTPADRNSSVYLWLSMPSNAVAAEYYSPTPWQLIAVHS
jgi:hypothetical protein